MLIIQWEKQLTVHSHMLILNFIYPFLLLIFFFYNVAAGYNAFLFFFLSIIDRGKTQGDKKSMSFFKLG